MQQQKTAKISRNICPGRDQCDKTKNGSENCLHYEPHPSTYCCHPDLIGADCPGCVPFNFQTCPYSGTWMCCGDCSECRVY